MGKSWKIHYFDWAMFNSKLLVYQRVSDVLHGLVFVGKSVNICCVNYVQRVFWTTALPLWPSNCDIKGQLDKPRDGWGPSHGHRLAVWANLVMQPSNAAIYIYTCIQWVWHRHLFLAASCDINFTCWSQESVRKTIWKRQLIFPYCHA